MTSTVGAAALVFTRSRDVVADMVRALDPHGAPQLAGDSSHLHQVDGTPASLAVLQLLALGRVLHSWLAQHDDADPGREHTAALRDIAVDASIADAITEIIAELENHALVDPLTSLLNRRALDRDLTRALATARRHRHPLSVVMIDVDGLKGTNDNYGHDVGDEACGTSPPSCDPLSGRVTMPIGSAETSSCWSCPTCTKRTSAQ